MAKFWCPDCANEFEKDASSATCTNCSNKINTPLKERPRLVHIGFHQETAGNLINFYDDKGSITGTDTNRKYIERVEKVLAEWKSDKKIWKHLEFLTVEQAAARFFPQAEGESKPKARARRHSFCGVVKRGPSSLAKKDAPNVIHDLAFPKVLVVISVDWDGFDVLDENLDAMNNFRDKSDFKHIPITHFLSAGYFSGSPSSEHKDIAKKMRKPMRDIDELGLHVHCYYSLLKSALKINDSALKPFKKPNWGNGGKEYYNKWKDGGHAKPFSDFSDKGAVVNILKDSKDLLESQGFKLSKSYRSGGWVMNNTIMEALCDQGFEIDSSAVPYDKVKGKGLADGVLDAAWSWVNTNSQPRYITAPGGVKLKEVPDNCALADYFNVAAMKAGMKLPAEEVMKDLQNEIAKLKVKVKPTRKRRASFSE